MNQAIRSWLASLGPGIITAALVFGPGSLTLASKIGSLYGYQLLWVSVVATVFMIVFTRMAARIGLANEASLLTIIREKWGHPVATLLGVGVFLVVSSFQAGNTIGVGLAFSELYGTSSIPWIIGMTLVGIGLLFFRSFYKVLEKVMMLLVGLMLVAFLGTVVMARPSLTGILSGLSPIVPTGSELLIIALVASTFSVVGAFYQSYLVQERGWKAQQRKQAHRESTSGIVILGLIGSMVLISAAAVLNPQSIEVKSATDMAKALEPLLGPQAKALFMYGLFGASFSSLIGNATIGGSLLGDALGYNSQLHSGPVRLLIALVMILGAAIAVVFGKLPLELIVFAQSITILIVPFIGVALIRVANDLIRMKELVNTLWQNVLAFAGLALLIILALANAKNLFF
ncbi:divalent metal cation transporter [Rhabdobacter roseus]|uniref:Mn2+/Fe2+ NRAMP family transporter n=1 Tax=Rhabdobacter roseus TaxID=1655419 RepID=A0A840TKU5_9BACT|nr:Nramp family divalent metal transporter [Rhabdobacter roseus]MBB5284141.1 Mn2+/Fe2+ NRAMP family transporter [Rhabdobacter roseus]